MTDKDPREWRGTVRDNPRTGETPESRAERHLEIISRKLDKTPTVNFSGTIGGLGSQFDELLASERRIIEALRESQETNQAILGMSSLQTAIQMKMIQENREKALEAFLQRDEIIENTAQAAVQLQRIGNLSEKTVEEITAVRRAVDANTDAIFEMKTRICNLLEDLGMQFDQLTRAQIESTMRILESLYSLKKVFIWSHREQMWVLNQQLFALTHPLQIKATEAYEIGELCRLDGEYEDAINMFTQSISTNPREVRSHFSLGLIQFNIGDIENAKEGFRKAALYSPDKNFSSYSMMHQSKILMIEKNYNEALKLLLKAHELDPENIDVIYELAVCCSYLGEFEHAYLCFEKLYNLNPHQVSRFFANPVFKPIIDRIAEKLKKRIANDRLFDEIEDLLTD